MNTPEDRLKLNLARAKAEDDARNGIPAANPREQAIADQARANGTHNRPGRG